MIINNSNTKQVNIIVEKLKSRKIPYYLVDISGVQYLSFEKANIDFRDFEVLLKGLKYTLIDTEYKLASKLFKTLPSIDQLIIAGPCSIESFETLLEIAKSIKTSGATHLRGGAYKPRTSPYSFSGLQEEGLKILFEVGTICNLKTISEIPSKELIPVFEKYIDIIQVGARNMQNFDLLRALGKTKKPILLKRGMSATVHEWILAAEYIIANGNPQVILCERGIRTFEPYTRNTLDLSSVLMIQELTNLPVIVDPSHGTGHRSMVSKMALASLAIGADGIMVEVHVDPSSSVSDGFQTIDLLEFEELSRKIGAQNAKN